MTSFTLLAAVVLGLLVLAEAAPAPWAQFGGQRRGAAGRGGRGGVRPGGPGGRPGGRPAGATDNRFATSWLTSDWEDAGNAQGFLVDAGDRRPKQNGFLNGFPANGWAGADDGGVGPVYPGIGPANAWLGPANGGVGAGDAGLAGDGFGDDGGLGAGGDPGVLPPQGQHWGAGPANSPGGGNFGDGGFGGNGNGGQWGGDEWGVGARPPKSNNGNPSAGGAGAINGIDLSGNPWLNGQANGQGGIGQGGNGQGGNAWQNGQGNGNRPGINGQGGNPWQNGQNNGIRPANNGQGGNSWQNGQNNGNRPGTSGQGSNPWQNGQNNGNRPGTSGQGSNPWQNGQGNGQGNNGNLGGAGQQQQTRPTQTQRPNTNPSAIQGVRPPSTPRPDCGCQVTGEYNPVCGTDGATYSNQSALRCSRICARSSLAVKHLGACTTPAPTK